MSFDLTNKNISDTFQHLLQTTGSDGNELYDLQGNPIIDLRISGSLIAEQYTVSSSTSYITTSYSAGSTEFGDTAGDTHKFTGSIRVKGNIETSDGDIIESPTGTASGSTVLTIGHSPVRLNLNSLDEHTVGWTGMILTQSRVGIGTDAPSATLHVHGIISSSGPVEYLADIGTNVVYSSTGSSNATADSVPANRFAINVPREDMSGLTHELTVSGSISASGDLHIDGTLTATRKSFEIPHPTKPNKRLTYGSLEGPEYGVYIRGKLENKNIIYLPEYWTKLVDKNTITVQLTPIKNYQKLYVEKIKSNKVYVGKNGFKNINCYYNVYAERKDGKIEVEGR